MPLLRLTLFGLALGVGLGVGSRLALRAGAGRQGRGRRLAARSRLHQDRTARDGSVVNISAVQVYRTTRSPFATDPFFEFFGRDFPFRVPQEERKTSLGSGVLVSASGLIVTNNHVVQNARQIVVTLNDRRRLTATLVGVDAATDIAVVRVEGRDFPTLSWGDSSRSAVGEYVLAIGNPFQLNQTVTMGIISATGRANLGIVDYEDFIQTDAAINPGNSGGALVNRRAELIGINSAIYSETGGYQGIGFAVPSNLARKVADEIVANGRVRRGSVGITQIRTLDEATARALGLPSGRGAVIFELLRGSAADRAGVEPGDVVVAVNEQPLEDAAHLRNALAAAEVGSHLTLTVQRQGRSLRLRVMVEESRAAQ